MSGVTCERPIVSEDSKGKRYEIRRFATRSAYEASDLHPSRRNKSRKASKASKKSTGSRQSKSVHKLHRLRLRQSKLMPTTTLGMLSAVPKENSDPFDKPRQWADGVLPSFRDLGAIGKGGFGGIVIYPDDVYKKHQKA